MDPPTANAKRQGLLTSARLSNTFILRLHSTTKGSVLVRILGISTGLGLIVSSLFICEDWIELGRFDVAECLTSIVSIILGGIGMLLETNTLFDINNVKRHIISFAPSLERVSGRGMMYICCGTLQVLVRLSVFALSGSFAVASGGFMVYTGQQAEQKLAMLRKVLANDESVLIEQFRKRDGNGDGMLEKREFKALVDSMYLDLDDEEMQRAFEFIDTNNDHKIAFDEFRRWVREMTAEFEIPNETFYSEV